MLKIMLVLDNSADEEFLEEVLKRLSYIVVSVKKTVNFSEELIDHFPDLVFASTLGKNEKILSALAKIKQARGKPKLVFVRQQKEEAPLNDEQKQVIDGVLYTPIDPFKLIDLLAATTDEDIVELRRRYNQMLNIGKKEVGQVVKSDRGNSTESPKVSAGTQQTNEEVITGRAPRPSRLDEQKSTGVKGEYLAPSMSASQKSKPSSFGGVLLFDSKRKNKYDQLCAEMEPIDREVQKLDVKKMKTMQKTQVADLSSEDQEIKENRKHFIKILFSTDPGEIKGQEEE